MPPVAQFFFLLLLLLTVRLVGIQSFPEPNPDEGFWLSAPKNYVLFLQPLLDGRFHLFLSPLMFILHSAGFSILGPSLFHARFVSAVIGVSGVTTLFFARPRLVEARWLFPLLAGVGSLLVLYNRRAMTEAPQVALLCCFLACLTQERLRLGVVCLALAILIKVNSLIVVPAFCIYMLTREGSHSIVKTLGVTLTPVVLAGGVYFLLYLWFPRELLLAFQYELDGNHFLENANILHFFGRFGLNVPQLLSVGVELIKGLPELVVLGSIGIVISLRERPIAPLIATCLAWLTFGVMFYVFQTFSPARYYLTLIPPLAFFATRGASSLFLLCARYTSLRKLRIITGIALSCVCFYHSARVFRGVNNTPDRITHHALTSWGMHALPRSSRLLAAPFLCIDLKQECYDFYRALYPYGMHSGPTLREVIAKYQITHLVVDTEWKELLPGRNHEIKENAQCSYAVLDATIARTYEHYTTVTPQEATRIKHSPCP
jgi:ALG3 protein